MLMRTQVRVGFLAVSLACSCAYPAAADDNVLHGEWPVVGQDYGNRANAPSTIDASNAGSLFVGGPIFFPTTFPVAAQPAVADGTVYFGDAGGNFNAIDFAGNIVWQTFLGNEILTTPVITKDFVYVPGGELFGGFHGAQVQMFCLSRADGALVWSAPVASSAVPSPSVEDFTGDATVVGDLVIVGVANTENSGPALDFKARGSVVAFDRFTGEERWRFFTTSDQELENPEFGGGVGVWASPGVDLERGLLYIGTGQSFETPISPYQDSLLALNIKNGSLKMHSQMNINDVWAPNVTPNGPDWDVNTHTNLFSVDIDGEGSVDFVGVGDKSGRYYILRRDANPKKIKQKNSPPIDAILYLDQGSVLGTIQSTPTIDDQNDVLYVASDALVGVGDARTSMNGVVLLGCDPLDIFCYQGMVVPKLRAYDLGLLLNGAKAADALLWESANDANNKGQSFGPLTLSNDVIFQTNGYGAVRIIAASDGANLAETFPLGPGTPIFGGVTAVGDQVFVPTLGGLVSYKLP